ncbi:hypothetical protein FQN50_002540 [Emmonsiellopsis sp. PD_5]|nr:hypothetical protein FQN50_002540 [Emmonsiellopsis sp. PD_5]
MDSSSSPPPTSSFSTSPASSIPTSSVATLSIYQLARLYHHEQLLVDPFHWTSRHVELLQCSFEEPVCASSSLPPSDPETSDHVEGNTGEGYVKALFTTHHRSWGDSMSHRMIRIFLYHESPFTQHISNTAIWYGTRDPLTTCPLPCTIFSLQSADDENPCRPPVVAYVDRCDIDRLRARYIRIPSISKRWKCEPILALHRLKIKKATPSDPYHDPYIVALMIGLAIKQYYLQCQDQAASANLTFSVWSVLLGCPYLSKLMQGPTHIV